MDPRLIKVFRVHFVSSGEWKYNVHDPVGMGVSRVILDGGATTLISY
jgi:hypothetical protein